MVSFSHGDGFFSQRVLNTYLITFKKHEIFFLFLIRLQKRLFVKSSKRRLFLAPNLCFTTLLVYCNSEDYSLNMGDAHIITCERSDCDRNLLYVWKLNICTWKFNFFNYAQIIVKRFGIDHQSISEAYWISQMWMTIMTIMTVWA